MMRALALLKAAVLVVSTLTLPRSAAFGAIDQQFFVSNNNKLYYVIKVDPTAGIGAQVTSLMMTSGVATVASETFNGALPDLKLTAVATSLSGSLLGSPSLANIKRTEILQGFVSNDIINDSNLLNGEFDPNANGGDGLLTLPDGNTVSLGSTPGTIPLQAITTSSGAGDTFVPAANTTTISRRLGGTTLIGRPTIVFPSPTGTVVTSNGATCGPLCSVGIACDPANNDPASPDDLSACNCGGSCTNLGGEAADQNVTLDDTIQSRVGNPSSQPTTVDGFLLRNTQQIIVFAVDGSGSSAFGISVAGFSVVGTCAGGPDDGISCPVVGGPVCVGGIFDGDSCVNDSGCAGFQCRCEGGACGSGLSARNVLDTTGDVDGNQFNTPTPTSATTNTPTPTEPSPEPTNTPTPEAPTDTPTPTGTATPAGCPPTVGGGCTTGFAKGILQIKQAGTPKLIAKLLKGPALAQTDFGNPLTAGGTGYLLCIYDDVGSLKGGVGIDRAGDLCAGDPCWNDIGGAPPTGTGYKYKDGAAQANGVFKILLTGGETGKSKALVKGKGSNLPSDIAAALQLTTSVTVQLRADDAQCVSVTLGSIVDQRAESFKAK